MFKGNNEITINHSTMIDAVQLYLDSQFKSGCSPKVKQVNSKSNDGGFIIKTEEQEKEIAPGD